MATAGEIGSTWGVAYSKQAKKLFTGAFLKRHVGLGPLGSGGIYLIDPSTGGVTNWLDLDAIGIATRGSGTYTGPGPSASSLVPFSPVIGTNTQRALGNGLDQPSHDAPAYAQIGRLSLGDVDISDDGRYLFVMNLFDKTVYRIDLVDPLNPQAPTAANAATRISSWAVPSPGCTNGEHRPFGLEFARGNLFVGVVCSGENGGGASDLEAYVYQITDFVGGTYSTLFNIPLDYDKGYATSHFGNIPAAEATKGWFAWSDDAGFTSDYYADSHPQPILSDIVFDSDGSLILAFMDRLGHQLGWNNYNPHNTQLVIAVVGGDLLRAYYNPTSCTYELESNGKEGPSSPKPATGGAGNGEGPGGGEFYYRDCFTCFPDGYHQETVQGGIAVALGSGEVAAAVIDPAQYDSGGLTWFNNTTGLDTKDYELYFTGNSGSPPPSGTFSKANGLGDLEVTASLASIEIGNRVWLDTDGDGIQDAGETPIAGVTVQLVKNGTVIATATTDASGNYYFSSATGTSTASAIYGITQLMPNMQYTVRIPNVQGGSKQAALGTNSLTTANADGSTNGDLRDSDGTLVGNNAEVTVLTTDIAVAGANNHTFDFGFSTISCTLSVSCTPTPQSSCTPLNGGASVAVTGGQGTITYLWSSGETTSSISGKAAGTYTVTVTDDVLAGCTATCQAVIASTATLPTATCSKVDNTNCATPNGSASVVTNGNQILWSNGGTTATISNLSVGTYTVTVTNTTTGCTNTCQSVVATTTTLPTATCSKVDNTNCATPNGSASVVTNGNQILWSNGGTTATISNLSAGTYTVTVTNTTTGCTNTCQSVVATTTTLPTATCSKVDNTNCATPNGSASVVTNGNQILWSNGGTTATISNLSAGTYTVTVTNTTTGCTNTCQSIVGNSTVTPTCSITVNSQPSCATLNGGSVTVVPSPAGTYSYVWNTGATTATVNNLTGGTYIVTVTNTSTSCTGVCQVTLATPMNCCNINTITIQSLECLDNGTPSLMTDNRLRIGLMAVNSNTSLLTFNLSVNGGTTITPTSGTYGALTYFTLGPGTGGSGATYTLTLTDSVTSGCTSQVQVISPMDCVPATQCPTPECGTATIQVNNN
ncbi:MAG: hypothetical protein H6567_06550 [Lewinellaceae bacterium]|nr:hypothetical protein [Lewinellaceae bacterium]